MGDHDEHGQATVPPGWGLRTPDGEPITTLEQLLALLLVERAPLPERRRTLGQFLSLPVAASMPDALRAAVEADLDG